MNKLLILPANALAFWKNAETSTNTKIMWGGSRSMKELMLAVSFQPICQTY